MDNSAEYYGCTRGYGLAIAGQTLSAFYSRKPRRMGRPSGLLAASRMPSFDAGDCRARGTAAAVSHAAWNGPWNESIGNPPRF